MRNVGIILHAGIARDGGGVDAGGVQDIIQHHTEVLPLDAGVRIENAVAAAAYQAELICRDHIGVVTVAERLFG